MGSRSEGAATLLDEIVSGAPAEQVLTRWARKSRYAGSRDRAAVRDLVFDVLRCKRSYGWCGGGDSGRALMLGRLVSLGEDVDAVFTGARHAPAAVTDEERARLRDPAAAPRAVRADIPDWLLPALDHSLGDQSDAILDGLRTRAPVVLRANPQKTTRQALSTRLTEAGFEAVEHPLARWAIEVRGEPRGLSNHASYLDGWFELQDAASQAAVEEIGGLVVGAQVLDFCAGGGGKSLALAAQGAARITAHDVQPRRMRDIATRAARAGIEIETSTAPSGVFDVVVCDVPCSGSGAWRRQPDAKWRLTPERLDELYALQSGIVDTARAHVAPGGYLVYMTCSLLRSENEDQIAAAQLRHPDLNLLKSRRFTPVDGGDGFFVAVFGPAPSKR